MQRIVWLCFLAFVCAMVFASRSATAHDWYPVECCSGRDCAPIGASAVRETPAGYVVTVAAGQHPLWDRDKGKPLVLTVPYGKAKHSPDGRFHLCINPSGDLLCFFAAIGGF